MSTTAPPLVETRDLAVNYGGRCALRPTNLVFGQSESVAIVGRNGSGKSSLLRALCGQEPGASGEVILHAERCHHRRTGVEIAYVAQRAQARWDLPFMVAEVVLAGRPRRARWRRVDQSDRNAVEAALETVGLAGFGGRSVRELSGGQAQRVLLARALVQEPDVMVMDEPLTGLDMESAEAVTSLIGRFVAEGRLVCCAIHEIAIARAAFGRTVALIDGAVAADGPTADVLDAEGVERVFIGRVGR